MWWCKNVWEDHSQVFRSNKADTSTQWHTSPLTLCDPSPSSAHSILYITTPPPPTSATSISNPFKFKPHTLHTWLLPPLPTNQILSSLPTRWENSVFLIELCWPRSPDRGPTTTFHSPTPFSTTLREPPTEAFSSPKPPEFPTPLRGTRTRPAYGPKSKSKHGNPSSMPFTPKAASSFVRFGTWEEFQIQLISQMGKLRYHPRTSHSHRKFEATALIKCISRRRGACAPMKFLKLWTISDLLRGMPSKLGLTGLRSTGHMGIYLSSLWKTRWMTELMNTVDHWRTGAGFLWRLLKLLLMR